MYTCTASCRTMLLEELLQTMSQYLEKMHASEALQKNFYADNLLKSSKDVEAAKELVKDVMTMCKTGGFHLTKFISNSKKLILSIPKSQIGIGVKDQDLSGQLPNEKALGM